MSAGLGNDDFYQNLLRYMNQNTQSPSTPLFNNNPNSALSFSPHEAEKHSLDETMMDENDSKRRESEVMSDMDSGSDEPSPDIKPKKKPGRKMMTTEPTNKRKAQNRAAQRAFRERKEAHVKGLETRVTELEDANQQKDTENAMLKSQIEALQAELMAQRGGNLNFDFSMKNAQQPAATTTITSNNVRNPFQINNQPIVNGQQTSPSPSSGSITDSTLFRSGQSSLATSPENDANKTSTPNIDIPFDLFSSNTAGPVTFNNPSNHTSPLFSTDVFNHSANGNTSALFGNNQSNTTSPILDTFASTLASLTRQSQSPHSSLSNGFNAGMSSSTSTAPLSAFTPGSTGNLFDINDPLFNNWRENWRDNSISSNDDNGFDIFDTMFSSMSPGAFNLVDPTGLTDFITDSPLPITQQQPQQQADDPGITCPQLWDKVKNHPNFDEIDIDQLCAEMRNKAKCSNTGSLVSSRDVDETIARFVKSS